MQTLKRILKWTALILLVALPYFVTGVLIQQNRKLQEDKADLIQYATLLEMDVKTQTERLMFVTGLIEAMSQNAYICEGEQQ